MRVFPLESQVRTSPDACIAYGSRECEPVPNRRSPAVFEPLLLSFIQIVQLRKGQAA